MPLHSILLISGDEALTHHLNTWLNRQSDYVLAGHCQTIESAAECSPTIQAALLLVDLETPDAIERERWSDLVRAYPQVPIISLVTSATNQAARQRATHAGALLFLAKAGGEIESSVNLEAALQQTVKIVTERTLKPFTPREREVLLLMADGLTNLEIAQRLVVSEKTVKRHVGAILEKLEVDNRVKVALWAWEHGLAGTRGNE